MPLSADRDQIAKHVTALFMNADNGSFLSLRAFEDAKSGKAWGYGPFWKMMPISDSFTDIIDAIEAFATAAANAPTAVCVCPPACSFANSSTAAEADVANGLVLVVEIDDDAPAGRAKLEALLGPPTEVVASGGVSVNPQTGQVDDREHVYWRLSAATRTLEQHARLKECRELAARYIGSDTTAVSLVHPLRVPGSWHRKNATARCARIIEYNPDNEIVLDDALDRLRRAVGKPTGGRLYGGAATPQAPLSDILKALEAIPNDDSGTPQQCWDQWSDMALRIYAATAGSENGRAAFHMWSAKSAKYDEATTDQRWDQIKRHPPTRTDVRALFNLARAAIAASQPAASAPAPQRPWPKIDDAAFFGLAGDLVRLLRPHTEADPVAILLHFLVEVGNAIGRHAYYLIEADRHYPNLFALIVGRTSKARKGTSAGRARQVLEIIDPDWAQKCFRSGLSTGEGVIWKVRDEVRETVWKGQGLNRHQEEEITDPGVEDKRLCCVESEFARTISVMERAGNTLSAVLRQAWDCGNLEILTKTSAARATDAHVSICAHITIDELVERFTQTDKANGFGNRFLFAVVRRSQLLPFGGSLKRDDLLPIAQRVSRAVELAETVRQVEFSVPAAERWQQIYTELSKEKPGLTGAVLARGEAQTIRLALIYALLAEHAVIDTPHLEAARAVWAYCEASAEYIFGDATGDAMADEILRELRGVMPNGLTQNDIRNLFAHHHSAARLGAALDVLLQYKKVRRTKQMTLGRPATTWFAL
jgi:hypothetical protein